MLVERITARRTAPTPMASGRAREVRLSRGCLDHCSSDDCHSDDGGRGEPWRQGAAADGPFRTSFPSSAGAALQRARSSPD